MQVSVSVLVSTRNDQSQSRSRLLRLSGLSLSLKSRPDKDLVSVSVSIPKNLVSSAAGSNESLYSSDEELDLNLRTGIPLQKSFEKVDVCYGCVHSSD